MLIIQLILYKRDELTVASCSSFNIKPTVARSMILLPYTVIYTRIRSYQGKWPLALITSNSCINDCIPVTENVRSNCDEEHASLASKLPVSSAQISVETNGEEYRKTPMYVINVPCPKQEVIFVRWPPCNFARL